MQPPPLRTTPGSPVDDLAVEQRRRRWAAQVTLQSLLRSERLAEQGCAAAARAAADAGAAALVAQPAVGLDDVFAARPGAPRAAQRACRSCPARALHDGRLHVKAARPCAGLRGAGLARTAACAQRATVMPCKDDERGPLPGRRQGTCWRWARRRPAATRPPSRPA